MKEIHSIIRTEKVKTFGQLAAKNNHNHRLSDVPNASPEQDIKVLIGSDDIVSDVKKHMINKGINPDKIRKNGVLCNELICQLSPEYFTDHRLDYKEKYNRKNTVEFVKIAKKFLISTYGENLVSLVVHLDETSPHIHAIVVPVYHDASSGLFKLAAKRFFDRPKLKLLQKRYCASFRQLKGYEVTYNDKSKAKHNDIQSFYSNINQTKLNFEAELAEKDNTITELKKDHKKLINERTILTKEVRNYELKMNKIKQNVKKLKEYLPLLPKQLSIHIIKIILNILDFSAAKSDDEIIDNQMGNIVADQPNANLSEETNNKSSRKLNPLAPIDKPKP